MNDKSKSKVLNFEGCETVTTDIYYDIVNGYYTNEINDEYTKTELQNAIKVINALESYLQEQELVG